jgi:hypothetical protein
MGRVRACMCACRLHHLSKVELSFPCATAECPIRTIDIVGTPQQAAILLLFNETGAPESAPPSPLQLGSVCRRLGLTRSEGGAVVASLVASKVLHPPEQRRGGGAAGAPGTPGDYDAESTLALRAGLGLPRSKANKPRSKIKLTSIESALQQLQRSSSSSSSSSSSASVSRTGSAGGGSGEGTGGARARSSGDRTMHAEGDGVGAHEEEDDPAGEADESLFEGGSPSLGGRSRSRASPGEVGSSLQEERKQVLQAAIVRVLKTKKTYV